MSSLSVEPSGVAKSHFRSDIQGLRALAVLLVVFDHLLHQPAGGFIGVDVFFVISGFLITSLLIKEGERTGRISLREFYARRVRRIVPVALLVLAATTVASYLVFLPSRAAQTVQDALWAGAFLANVHFARSGTDYFDQGLPPSPLQHYWSLSVEEQFYVVWPLALLALFAAARRVGLLSRRGTLGAIAVLVSTTSLAWSVHLTHGAPTDAYFSTATRAWELGLGALVAIAQTGLLRLPEWLRGAAAWTGLAGIGVSSLLITDDTPFPGSAAVFPVLATAVVLAAGNPRRGPGATLLLANPLVQYVGNISYSLYLWHWPCIVLATAYYGTGNVPFYVAAAVLPALLSVLSFHVLEDPVRRSRWLSPKPAGYRRLTRAQWYRDNKRGLDIALVGSAATAFFLAGWLDSTGVPDTDPGSTPASPVAVTVQHQGQLSPQQRLVATALGVKKWGQLTPSLDSLRQAPEGCTNVSPQNVQDCVYGDRTGAKTAVVLGDSIAMAWTPTVIAALADQGWRVQMLTMSECSAPDLPTFRNRSSSGVVYVACQQHRSWVQSEVKRLRPDLVVAASLPEFANRIVGVDSGDPRKYGVWRDGTVRALQGLKPFTRRIVLLGAPPNSGNLQTCVTARSSPADCVLTVSPHLRRVAAAELEAAKLTGSAYVNPIDWFCFQNRCPAVIDSMPVMRDGTHGTAAYMRRLASLLRPVLLGASSGISPVSTS